LNILELASEAEARKVLYAVYELRKNESNVDLKELYTIRKCLSFIHFLSKENEKVNFYDVKIKTSFFNFKFNRQLISRQYYQMIHY
jgi:hypothetical protein